MIAEQRKDPRIRTKDIAAHIRDDRGTRICSIDNLSLGGAFIRIADGPAVGSLVGVSLVRPGMKRVIMVSARVVSIRLPNEAASRGTIAGVGLAFENLSQEATIRMTELLAELGATSEGTNATRSSASGIVSASPPHPASGTGASSDAAAQVLAMKRLIEERDLQLAALRRQLQSAETMFVSTRQSYEAERHKHIAEIERLSTRNTALEKQVVDLTTELGGLRRKIRG